MVLLHHKLSDRWATTPQYHSMMVLKSLHRGRSIILQENLVMKRFYVVSIPVKVFLEEGLIIDFNGVPYPSHVNVDYSNIKSKNGRIKVSKRIKEHCKVAYRP